MNFIEEKYARDLYGDLVRYFEGRDSGVKLSLEGAGVHWKCTASQDQRSADINCFNYPKDNRAEYFVSFKESGNTVVSGRAASTAEAIKSVSLWVGGKCLAELETQFAFIDACKRGLTKIADEVSLLRPEIQKTTSRQVKQVIGDLFELSFVREDRHCKLSYHGKNEFPDATFYWDKCPLFKFSADDSGKLAAVISDWLCANAMPSMMRLNHAWLEIGELADYYELGRPVEGEFIMSWNETERFYESLKFPQANEILKLINEIRKLGYDKTLRAGTSMFNLILSRSRRHGLRLDQPRICLMFPNKRMEVLASFQDDEKRSFNEIKFQPPIDTLLRRLVEVAVD